MIDLTDKKRQLSNFKAVMFDKTLSMFEWEGLPESLPEVELEKLLQLNGFAVIAKYEGKLYAFDAGFKGQNVYNRPTHAIINNPALKFNATLELDKECVLIKNDDMQQGLTKVYDKYGQMLIENEITMLINDYNKRIPFTISASDDSTIASAKAYLQKIIEGSIGVIGENKLFKSLNINQASTTSVTDFADLYGYHQFLTAELNNLIGLATNNNMKRERLTTNEIEVNKNASYPFTDNMLKNRQTAVDKINKLFDTDINVKFSSIWGSTNEGTDITNNNGSDHDQSDSGSFAESTEGVTQPKPSDQSTNFTQPKTEPDNRQATGSVKDDANATDQQHENKRETDRDTTNSVNDDDDKKGGEK